MQNTKSRNRTQKVTNSRPRKDFRSVIICTFHVRSLCCRLYIFGTFAVLLPVHFRYALCVTACTFSVRSLCYCLYIFGTLSALLPVHFRYALCVTACTLSVRSLCYCLYIFGALSVLLPVNFRYALCVTACTVSMHVCHTIMSRKKRSREAVAKPIQRLPNHKVTQFTAIFKTDKPGL